MGKRLYQLMLGSTLSSLAISMLIKSNLGCFSVTAANMALANWFGVTVGVTGMILELIMLSIATYKGEGVGLTALVNATYGSLIIDFFNLILPQHPLMVLGIFLIPIGWAYMGKAGLGDTGSNILTNALIKSSNKSLSFIRGIQESVFLLLGILGARSSVTWLTIVLTFGLGYLMQFEYELIKYNPTEVQHKFIIRGKH